MAVEIVTTGNGSFAGTASSVSGYSVSEDATPIEPSDSSGGTGQISFAVAEHPTNRDGATLLLNDTLVLTDGSNGTTSGTVNDVSIGGNIASITADSRLGVLIAKATALPQHTTLNDAFRYYLSLAGITTGIFVDPSIASRPVVYPGWNDSSIWFELKALCAAEQVEISLVSNNIVMRPIRTRQAETLKQISAQSKVSNIDLAQSVEVKYYNTRVVTNDLIYPAGGWDKEGYAADGFQVDAGQIIVENIPLTFSIESLQQPTAVDYVPREYVGPSSVYSVSGNDGLGIRAAQWLDDGGSVTLAMGKDGTSIDVTIIGAKSTNYAPYRIAVTSGPSNYYGSLRIIGSGVAYDEQTLTIPTGAPLAKAAQKVGITVENRYIDTMAKAYDVGIATAARYGSASQTVDVETTIVNRKGEPGSVTYPTFADFNAAAGTQTFGQFNVVWANPKTFDDFNDAQFALVESDFANQAFGNVAGARYPYRSAQYRIRSGTVTEQGVSFSAERDTIFADHNSLRAGQTFAQFNATYNNMKFEDFAVVPLW